MKLTKKKSQKILPPAGSHLARLVKIIDLGTTYNEKFDSTNRYIDLTWELPSETHVFDEEKGAQPFLVSRKFTQNIGAKAHLGMLLKSWLGTEPEEDFEMTTLYDLPCMVTVIHNEVSKDGSTNTYANVQGVVPVPKGMPLTDSVTPKFTFDIDEFDEKKFDMLPEFMKDIITESAEYQEMGSSDGASEPAAAEKDELDLG